MTTRTAFSLLVLSLTFGASAELVVLKHGEATCAVDTDDGARIISWKVNGDERLWMPKTGATDAKWRHGGIPLCWPWICDGWPKDAPHSPHGLAWCGKFAVKERVTDAVGDRLTMTFSAWGLSLEYTVALADSLSFVVKSKNESLQLKTMQFSIHPYFRLENRDQTALTGLEGLVFHDMREGKETNAVWKGEMKITDTFDHEFYRKSMRQLPATICELNGRRLEIASPQSDMLVVWNPGPGWTTEGTELYGGLEPDAWRHFMSVEPSIVPYTLIPGETRIFTARMRAWGGGGK